MTEPTRQEREDLAQSVEDRRIATADEATQLREELAELVEDRRAAFAVDLKKEKDKLAEKLAFDRGQEAARLDARLAGHDQGFERINGSVEKAAQANERVEQKVTALRDEMVNRFEALAASNAKAEKDATALALQARQDSRKQLFQIVGAAFVATITAGGGIVVALITTSPA